MDRLQQIWKEWYIQKILGIWLVWMLGVFLVSALIIDRIPLSESYSLTGFSEALSVWTNWDGNNYIVIAREGYPNGPESLYAFFPLLPWLIRIVQAFPGISYPFAGMIVSRLALLGALVYLVKLVEDQWGSRVAFRSAWYLLVFPTAFFYFAVYTESLFLFTTLAAWYYSSKQNWVLAAIFGFFAPLTRLVGILVAGVIGWQYMSSIQWKVSRIRWPIVAAFVPFLGLAVYSFQTWIQADNPLLFLEVQKYWAEIHGRGGYHNPLVILGREVWRVLRELPTRGMYAIGNLDLWFSLVPFIVLIWASMKKSLPWVFLIWSWLVWVIPIISGSLVSMPRYVAVLFPLSILLAIWSEDRPFIEQTYLWTAGLVMAVLLVRFVSIGHWVA